jgi:hypothetical protein
MVSLLVPRPEAYLVTSVGLGRILEIRVWASWAVAIESANGLGTTSQRADATRTHRYSPSWLREDIDAVYT